MITSSQRIRSNIYMASSQPQSGDIQSQGVNLLSYTDVIAALKSADASVIPCDANNPWANEATIPLTSLIDNNGRDEVTLLAMFTWFGDLTTFEYAQQLLVKLDQLKKNKINLVCVGIGSRENALLFSKLTNFPLDYVYADPDASCYKALHLYSGFLASSKQVHPYVKLLGMLVGAGSDGTIPRVISGYVGDRSRTISSWAEPTIKKLLPDPRLFDILGTNYTRPFELATVRLQNMIDILPNWKQLAPEKEELLIQQGGTLVIDSYDKKILYAHRDSGILVYADVETAISIALQQKPKRLNQVSLPERQPES